jgi:hypothetical protein
MKKSNFIAAFLFMGAVAFAQNFQDVVYLKNGSIIKGLIIEQIPDKIIKIKSGENLFVYTMDEVEKIVKEETKTKSRLTSGKSDLKKGYQLNLESGLSIAGWQDGASLVLRGNVVNGYRFNPYVSTGLGIGLRAYDFLQFINSSSNGNSTRPTLLPLYIDIGINFLDRKVSPYSATGLGYSFDVSDDMNGTGTFISQAFGATFKLSTKYSFNVGMNLEWQQGPYQSFDFLGLPSNDSQTYGSVGFVVGFSF